MIDTWQTVRCVRALQAFLVAVALLVAPIANVQAMPCHDHVGHEHSTTPEHSLSLAAHDHDGLQGSDRIADQMACCGTMCSFCLVATDTERLVVLDTFDSGPHLEWSNLVGKGVAFPPNLGPPRFRV